MALIFNRLARYLQPRHLSFSRLTIAGVLLVFGVLAACAPSIDQEEAVHVLTYEGTVDPVMVRYIDRGIDEAERTNARAVVIRLDTLGGLVTSMEKIVKRINASQVPVIVYVYPAGGQAASAGTFITMAGHIAAMAPGSVIGAASPVGAGGQDIEGTLGEKITEDLAALIRGIAGERGRNVQWAEKAVTEALAANACEAVGRCEVSEDREPPCRIDDEGVKRCIVDFEASTLESVLQQADGRRVTVDNIAVTLDLVEAPGGIVFNDRTLVERFFALLSDPNIAFLLLSLGGLGIFIEILNPGLLFPGIFGVIALVLAFFSIGTLPINWAGVALIGLAFALFAAEIFVSGFGILGIGGAVSLILGGLLLTSTSNSEFQVNRWLLFSVAIVIAAFFIVVAGALIRSRQGAPTIGMDAMVGRLAVARSVLNPEGTVFLDGARWRAHTGGATIEEGEDVVVTEVDGLTLTVEKPDEEESEES
ncbi:MAG: nodulation protein NfeD [Chloroflexi bacterium]|nr:nodulation protein NfeD [Chloroflexota bacterium]MCH8160816.1 nodulation protein NfeD [Chloroflexota bacterium]